LDISEKGDIIFALAREARDNKQYYDFLKNTDKYVILDNDIHELTPLSNNEYVQLAIDLGVDEIIAPDVLNNHIITRQQTQYFLNDYYDELKKHNIKIHAVCQGSSFYDMVECYYWMNHHRKIDVIGIPFRMWYKDMVDNKDVNNMLNRLYFVWHVSVVFNSWKPVHLLGMNNPLEVVFYKSFNFIRSIDSKLVVRCALSNEKFNENYGLILKPKRKMSFDDKLNEKQLSIVDYNIKFLRRYTNG
jgi:hypothetical protein